MMFSCPTIETLLLLLLIPTTAATICYECASSTDLKNCSLIDSQQFDNLGCLIEFEDPDDTGLRVRRIKTFCPNNFTECQSLLDEKSTWLTFVWKTHNPKTKQLRKNPILSMWYECFNDRCNRPEYVQSLMTLNVSWNTEVLERKSSAKVVETQCYTCSNQTVPFVCTDIDTCDNGCKMQGYRLGANPVASRLLTLLNVKYWQPKCNDDLKEYQTIDYSINGYVINNLNKQTRNIAIEAYCSHDRCNSLSIVSALMNTTSIHFQSEPWLSPNRCMTLTARNVVLFYALLTWHAFHP